MKHVASTFVFLMSISAVMAASSSRDGDDDGGPTPPLPHHLVRSNAVPPQPSLTPPLPPAAPVSQLADEFEEWLKAFEKL